MLTRRGLGLAAVATGALGVRPAWSQTPLSAEQQFMVEGRYLPQYLELKAQAAAGRPAAGGFLAQYAAFLGDEATAIGSDEKDRPADAELPDLSDAESRDALSAIVEAATDRQIVILNEAHNISGHRGFATRVMRALRPLGFDTFATETFLQPQQEAAPSIRRYRLGDPLHSGFGYYIADPVYAEAVREAAALGYTFADYEWRWDQRPPATASGDEQIAAREAAQVDNLVEAVLKGRPDARIFVLCGYSHAMELEGRGGLWFAARLKALTGIDPLTIEQSWNWPATRPQADAPHVAAVLKRFQPTAPIVVSRNGIAFANSDFEGRVDLSVFHPRLDRVAGRPGWLAADPLRKAVEVSIPAFEGPALLQALHMQEGMVIPADHFLLEAGQARGAMMLRPGAYVLRLETKRGIEPAFGEIVV